MLARLVTDGDLEGVGLCLDNYYAQKVVMAGGVEVCEPPHVTAIMERLRPYVYGQTLCGAGGGGFLLGITMEPAKSVWDELEGCVKAALVESLGEEGEVSDIPLLYAVEVDNEGLVMDVGPGPEDRPPPPPLA